MCFEARSNTACRNIHETAFELAFDEADEVHLGAVFRAERYPEGERINLPAMASRLGRKARVYKTNAELESGLKDALRASQKQVVVFFSNGSFDGVPQRIVSYLGKAKH